MISSLINYELSPACFSCSSIFSLSQSSSGPDCKYIVFELPEAEVIKPGDLSIFISVLPQVDLLPVVFTSKYISFAKSYDNFLYDKLARSTL